MRCVAEISIEFALGYERLVGRRRKGFIFLLGVSAFICITVCFFFLVFTTFLISRSSLSSSLFDGKDIQKLEKTFLFT